MNDSRIQMRPEGSVSDTKPKITILFAEDDDRIRTSVSAILEHHGYTVIPAVNGREALNIIAGKDQTIRLVILDLDMPVVDGFQVLSNIRRNSLPMKVIVTTGLETATDALLESEQPDILISKPYTTRVLLEHISRLLH